MITWLQIWTWLFIGVIVVFTALAIAVAIGGFFDVKALFRTIDEQHGRGEQHKKNDKLE